MENRRYRSKEKTKDSELPRLKAPLSVPKEMPETSPVDDGIQRRKMINLVRILVGIAVILVCFSLLIGLISWVRQDVITSMIFLQSGIQ